MGLAEVDELRPVPGFQLKVLAPAAARTMFLPLQIVPEVAVTLGSGLTVTEERAVLEQPLLSVPVTV